MAHLLAALWPERCQALVSVSGSLSGSREVNQRPLPSQAELAWWDHCYVATARGQAGDDTARRDFARLIWPLASPQWACDAATFERAAAACDQPDHVRSVMQHDRWRLGLAEGAPPYDALEQRRAQGPVLAVPTLTLEGEANGAPHPDARS